MVIKLLYIEDNDDNLYALTLRFETLGGYEVVTAVDGAEGIAKAVTERVRSHSYGSGPSGS